MIAVILFTGSHNITLLWGGLVIGVPVLITITLIVRPPGGARSTPVRGGRRHSGRYVGGMPGALVARRLPQRDDSSRVSGLPPYIDNFTFFDKFGVLFPGRTGAEAVRIVRPLRSSAGVVHSVGCGLRGVDVHRAPSTTFPLRCVDRGRCSRWCWRPSSC